MCATGNTASPSQRCLSHASNGRPAQADLEAQTRLVAEREAAAAEQAAALQRRTDGVAQAERNAAAGQAQLEAAIAARVRHRGPRLPVHGLVIQAYRLHTLLGE